MNITSLKNTIINKLSNFIRKLIIKDITGNLGKIVEDKDKITCYVKKNRCKKERYHYTIACRGISKKNKELAKKYHIDKPICYVLDGLVFKEDGVYIFGYNNCEVIIKNCTFDFNIDLHTSINGKCTIENTIINPYQRLSIYAKELIIKDMDIKNPLKYSSTNLDINLGADNKLEINNSFIGKVKEKTNVNLYCKNQIEIYNSKIAGEVVECKSQKLQSGKKSIIEGNKKVELKINDLSQTNIISPIIDYNGNIIDNKNKPITLKTTKDQLKIKRFELINLLKEIKSECEKTNKEKIDEYSTNLNKEEIIKVLKK